MSSPLAHGSIALIAKKYFPSIPLWILLPATLIPDALFYLFEFLSIEVKAVTEQNIYHGIQYISPAFIPWSHGLVMNLIWTVIVILIAFILLKNIVKGIVIGLMVLSHWILDAIVYSNLPLFFDHSIQVGLGLTNTGIGFIAGIIMELVLIIGALILFLNKKKEIT